MILSCSDCGLGSICEQATHSNHVRVQLPEQFRGVASREPADGSSPRERETAPKPTLAAVALLHLKRMAAIRAVEGHLIERVNGRFGPEAGFRLSERNGRFVRIAADLPRQDICAAWAIRLRRVAFEEGLLVIWSSSCRGISGWVG
jgi:hypothetical protein